jgi:hypothetical protein
VLHSLFPSRRTYCSLVWEEKISLKSKKNKGFNGD